MGSKTFQNYPSMIISHIHMHFINNISHVSDVTLSISRYLQGTLPMVACTLRGYWIIEPLKPIHYLLIQLPNHNPQQPNITSWCVTHNNNDAL